MLEISLNVYYTIALAIVVLMVGDFIKEPLIKGPSNAICNRNWG